MTPPLSEASAALHGKRILHVISAYSVSLGGSLTTMHNIASMWQDLGCTTHVLTLETAGQKVPLDVEFTALPPSFPARFSNSAQAASWLTLHWAEYDLVVFHSVWTIMYVRLAAILRRHRRRYAVIPHGSLDPFDLQKKSAFKRMLGPLLIRKYLQGSVGIVCSSQREAHCLVTYGARCSVHCVPWPIPAAPVHGDRLAIRQQLGFASGEFVVLSLGRVDYKKGFAVLLPAMKLLAQSGVATRLLIVGPDSGGYSAVVRRMIERLELAQIVTMLPPVVGEQKNRLFRAADCFALPSLNENFGNVVVEAMQQGLPCVISDNVYICDEVERSGAGLIHAYDVQALFAALSALALNADLRARMADAATGLAGRYQPEALKGRHTELLIALLGIHDAS